MGGGPAAIISNCPCWSSGGLQAPSAELPVGHQAPAAVSALGTGDLFPQLLLLLLLPLLRLLLRGSDGQQVPFMKGPAASISTCPCWSSGGQQVSFAEVPADSVRP